MKMELYSDYPRPVSEHFTELHAILRSSTILLLLAMIVWTYTSDSLMLLWLDTLPLGAASMDLSVYSPFDWLEVRWSIAILLSIITVMPYTSLKLQKFARPGMLPRERTWLAIIFGISTVLIPVVIIICWVYLLPLLVEAAQYADRLDDVGIRYDANALFRFTLGLSWVMVCAMLATVTLSMARLLGLVEHGETRFRVRLLLIFGGLLIITLPSEYDGLRVLIAVAAMLIADRLSRTLPSATLGKRSFDVADFTTRNGSVTRLALLDCSCEGACPKFPEGTIPLGIASPACTALCLDSYEQAAVAELVLQQRITKLVIGGCDSAPLPTRLKSTLNSLGCEYSGLGWLDEPLSANESWRVECIGDSTSQMTGSALD